MAIKIIVSYDGTNNEDDALALGRLLAAAGAEIALAYVAHEQGEGEQVAELLERGAAVYGDSSVERHAVENPSTPLGLNELAGQIGASAVIFCSDSHTAPGHVSIGNSARVLLEGGPLAVGIAPAGLAAQAEFAPKLVATIGDSVPDSTARSLAAAIGAGVAGASSGDADLLVIGSRPEAADGSVSLSAAAESIVEEATCPVLVLPAGSELVFGG